jgi:hypothetical protein
MKMLTRPVVYALRDGVLTATRVAGRIDDCPTRGPGFAKSHIEPGGGASVTGH